IARTSSGPILYSSSPAAAALGFCAAAGGFGACADASVPTTSAASIAMSVKPRCSIIATSQSLALDGSRPYRPARGVRTQQLTMTGQAGSDYTDIASPEASTGGSAIRLDRPTRRSPD